MKKIITSLLFVFISSFIFAQDSSEKDILLRSDGIAKDIKWQKSFKKA